MFQLSETLPRPYRDVHHVDLATLTVRPDDFEGYSEWSAALEQEPAADAPQATYITPEDFAALIAEDEPAPEPEATPARYIKKHEGAGRSHCLQSERPTGALNTGGSTPMSTDSMPDRFGEVHYLDLASLVTVPDEAPTASVSSARPSPREQRGRELAEAGHVHRHSEALFVVEGSRGARYLVRRDERRHSCDCPDFERYGARPLFQCKHGHAAAVAAAAGLVAGARGAA